MNRVGWKRYLFWILVAEGTGALAGFLTREGTQLYAEEIEKPPLSPPGIVFPIVWTLLYLVMGISAARIAACAPSLQRTRALWAFWLQLAFNFGWSLLFFGLQNFLAALFWLGALWLLILWMILSFAKLDLAAALLEVPYLLWVTFAGWLNLGVWWLNR